MFILSKIPKAALPLFVGCALCVAGRAQGGDERAPILQAAVDTAAKETCAEFTSPALKADQLAVTVIDLRGPAPVAANYRGDVRFYPASVIKLFYLAATHRWLEDG